MPRRKAPPAASDTKRLAAFEMWIYRRLGRIPWTEKRTNQYVLNQLNATKSLMKDIKSRKLKYFGHVKRHQNILKKCSGRGYRGKKMPRTSAQCLVWQHKGVDRKECDCMQCGSPEQNRMEVHSRQPSDWWRRHLIGFTIYSNTAVYGEKRVR